MNGRVKIIGDEAVGLLLNKHIMQKFVGGLIAEYGEGRSLCSIGWVNEIVASQSPASFLAVSLFPMKVNGVSWCNNTEPLNKRIVPSERIEIFQHSHGHELHVNTGVGIEHFSLFDPKTLIQPQLIGRLDALKYYGGELRKMHLIYDGG